MQSNTKWQCHTTASFPPQGHSHIPGAPESSPIMAASKTKLQRALENKKDSSTANAKTGPQLQQQTQLNVPQREPVRSDSTQMSMKSHSRPGYTSQNTVIREHKQVHCAKKHAIKSCSTFAQDMAECRVVQVLHWGTSICYIFRLLMKQQHAADHTFSPRAKSTAECENPSPISCPSIFAQESQAVQGSSAACALMYQEDK